MTARARAGTQPAKAAPAQRGMRWTVDDYLSYLLARAAHVIGSEFHAEVQAAGLSINEWRVLATLSDGASHPVGEVAATALAEQSTMTKLIGRMEREGTVTRSAGAVDRRQSLVRITAAGRAALGDLLARSKRHERAIGARLDAAEAASLKSALRKLIAPG